ncbi:DUF262 domain-containing protein [Acholeplasma laidlawii]|uniref:DUF262 domain-containing protein n=1 Tax=Acholeplasma laidlawii TaxID=2148 RepID=UPI0021F77873|nr:DUF262 domain-containing protein [Acholeplasma laidlawii]
MAYSIKEINLESIVKDGNIELPRFQRKSTWLPKARIELALSVFKSYPIGVSIIFLDKDGKRVSKKLLDGRQRRETLKDFFENPEYLYEWWKSASGYKTPNNVNDFQKHFQEKIDDFIQEDRYFDDGLNDDQEESETEEDYEEGDSSTTFQTSTDQLSELHKLIEIAHFSRARAKKGETDKPRTGITTIFDFKEYLTDSQNLKNELYDQETNYRFVDGKKLRKFIRDMQERISNPHDHDITKSQFLKYIEDKFGFKNDEQKKKFQSTIDLNWEKMINIIKIYKKIDELFFENRIGMIEVESINTADSQKIFELINTGGTQLTASEILSASIKWNAPIKRVSSDLENSITTLYEELGNPQVINHKKYVKWDFPASLYFLLENHGIKTFFNLDDKDVANKISIGFKLLAGIFTGGISKNNFDLLLKGNYINFDNTDELISELKTFFSLFKQLNYFVLMKSWNKSLSDITSEGAVFSYILMMHKHWKALGKPTTLVNNAAKIFAVNGFIMLDNTIYEYVSRSWRGSGDSLLKSKLKAYEGSIELFESLDKSKWFKMIDEIMDNYTINGIPVKTELNTLVYYYNILTNKTGDNKNGEIDHIIPQQAWKSVATINPDMKKKLVDNLFNLALLPHDLNEAKKDSTLGELASRKLHGLQTILSYEDIQNEDIDLFSDPNEYESIRKIKKEQYKEAFSIKRDKYLS